MLAPVTERGESIGLLELYLADQPAPETVAEIGQVAAATLARTAVGKG